jgi:hypothetical protein
MKHITKYSVLLLCMVFSMIIAPCNATDPNAPRDTKIACPDTFNAPLGKTTTFPVQLMVIRPNGSSYPAPWRNLRFKMTYEGFQHDYPMYTLYNHMFWTDWSNGRVNFKFNPGKVSKISEYPYGTYDLNITYSGNSVSGFKSCYKLVKVVVT